MLLPLLSPLLALSLHAQAPPPPVHSPEVHPDRKITFRLRAPKATEAAFFGDWMKPNTSLPMSKSADGVWSITVGPLPPSIYLYHFIVDSMTIADPVNPRIKLRSLTSASMVEVPATPAAFWQPQDVPHGDVQINWQKSKVLGGDPRAIWVYTPPGYEKSATRYPVLYLLHGSNDTAGGWTLAGQANFILDNLIAARAAVPMIVVMPYGHAVPYGSAPAVQAKNTPLFSDYLLQDVLPFIEAKYRTQTGRASRAIAGLSMGGGQAIHIGLSHLNLFSALGAFSAATPTALPPGVTPSNVNSQLKTFWIACGKDDFLLERNQTFHALLKSNAIRHTYLETAGLHTYTVWRQYLGDFVPLLFRP